LVFMLLGILLLPIVCIGFTKRQRDKLINSNYKNLGSSQ